MAQIRGVGEDLLEALFDILIFFSFEMLQHCRIVLTVFLELRSVSLDTDIVHQEGFYQRDDHRDHVDHNLACI